MDEAHQVTSVLVAHVYEFEPDGEVSVMDAAVGAYNHRVRDELPLIPCLGQFDLQSYRRPDRQGKISPQADSAERNVGNTYRASRLGTG